MLGVVWQFAIESDGYSREITIHDTMSPGIDPEKVLHGPGSHRYERASKGIEGCRNRTFFAYVGYPQGQAGWLIRESRWLLDIQLVKYRLVVSR